MNLIDVFNNFNDFLLLTNFNVEHLRISHVTVVDAPDVSQFIKGEEFILTSGYIFQDNPKLLMEAIRKYKELGCTAIGIKVNRFIKELPQEVIDFANSIEFPIIDIPTYYPFSDIINPILETVLTNQIEEMKFTENLYRVFMQMILDNKSIKDVFNQLYEIIHRDFYFVNYISNTTYSYGEKFEMTEDNFKQTIQGNGLKLGEFNCNVKSGHFSYVEKMAINYCIAIINIQINRDILVAKTKEQYLNDFITDMVNNNINSIEELQTRASILKKDISGEWFCVIFDIDNFKKNIVNDPDKNHNLENIKNKMFEKIINYIKSRNTLFHYFKKSDSIIFLIKENNSNRNIDDLKIALLNPIKKMLGEEFPNYAELTLTIGIGTTQSHIINIYKSYQEAMDSIKIGRILKKENSIVYFKDVEFFKNLKESIDLQENTPYFVKDFLNVVNYSSENENDYLETLIELIENNWSIKKTSEKQFLHYNTVKYRYDKIQQITGKNFENSADRFLLELSYRYFKLKNFL